MVQTNKSIDKSAEVKPKPISASSGITSKPWWIALILFVMSLLLPTVFVIVAALAIIVYLLFRKRDSGQNESIIVSVAFLVLIIAYLLTHMS